MYIHHQKNNKRYVKKVIQYIFSDNIHDIVVTWSTRNDTEESIVEYGIGGLILTATGNSTLFIDGGDEKQKQYIHRVWLKNLTPNSKYRKYNFL